MNKALRVSLLSVASLLTFVSVSPFFISPAFAQVNGLGPSPASSFDTVVNLPGDEAVVISGNFLDSIGGMPGQTIQLNISNGGSIDVLFDALAGSEVNVSSGGTINALFDSFSGSEINISGGDVESRFRALQGSVINISGGSFGPTFEAFSNSQINILGREFQIDGQQLDALLPGEAFTVTDRDVTLSGLLDSGEAFSFELNSVDTLTEDFFSTDATLTVTLVSSGILGDVNQDGVVEFEDIAPFIALLNSGGFQYEADVDEDGDVDFEDIAPFIEILLVN